MEFIESDKFLNTLNEDYKEQIIKILKEMIEIVATSIEKLTPSKLSPHKIRLNDNAKPVKLSNNRFNKVNGMTEKDSYSVPYIDEIFDCLGAKIFTTLDLFSDFHEILMDEESVEVTTFTTKYRNYQFKVMPFGLTGAPSTFQREMNKILWYG